MEDVRNIVKVRCRACLVVVSTFLSARKLRVFAWYQDPPPEDAMGGWKKEGLPKRGFGPPSYGTFSTPLRCQCSVFPVQKCTTEQTRSSLGGVQKFLGERVLWYVFLPPYVLHPPISRPNSNPPQWTVFASRRQGFTPTLRLVQNPVNCRQTP